MSSNSTTASGTEQPAVVIKPPNSAILRAWHEESLQTLEKIKLRRERAAQAAQRQEEYRAAILKEKKLPEEKFDVLKFCAKEQKKRRKLEIIRSVIGGR